MSQNIPPSQNSETASGSTVCENCHSAMPAGLRFCRNCGYRLGEGLAEYTETVRFQNGTSAAGKVGTSYSPGSYPPGFGIGGGPLASGSAGALRPRKKRLSGMTWIFIIIALFFIVGSGISVFVPRVARKIQIGGRQGAVSPPRSYFGVNSFDSTEGGVTFDAIEAPGSPADKAGLVGGDIITSFDGQPITDEDDMAERLRATPVGKTVDVIYLRDGETHTTKLTTISGEALEELGRVFSSRPEGRGRLGIDNQKTVEIPDSKLHGVRLGRVMASLPADMAGLKSGDIVIAFGEIPIRTAEELSYRIRIAIPYETVVIKVMRDAQVLDIPVKMGRQE